MKPLITLFIFFACNVVYCDGQQAVPASYEEGKHLTDNGKKLTVHSNILNEEKAVFIGLPEHFNDSTEYPVIIVLEGEILFETIAPMTRLMASVNEIPECVVVGIPLNNRHLDYAPVISSVPESGNADKMLRFYHDELFPLLAEKYHCTKDRIIWAHSGLGGIFCTYLLLGPDNQFDGIFSSSPNLKWVKEYIDSSDAFDKLAKKDTVFYYLTFGSNEAEDYMGSMFHHVFKFKNRLEKEAPGNLIWKYQLNMDETHFSNAIETFIDGLRYYFKTIN